MEQEAHNLVMATYIIGSIVVSLLSAVTVAAWKIKGGLDKRDARLDDQEKDLKAVRKSQGDHESECIGFRQKMDKRFDKIDERFDRGNRQFRLIERSLGKLEGAVGVKEKTEFATDDD